MRIVELCGLALERLRRPKGAVGLWRGRRHELTIGAEVSARELPGSLVHGERGRLLPLRPAGDSPQAAWPSGWTVVSLDFAQPDAGRRASLYADDGGGYRDALRYRFPRGRRRVAALAHLPDRVRGLLLEMDGQADPARSTAVRIVVRELGYVQLLLALAGRLARLALARPWRAGALLSEISRLGREQNAPGLVSFLQPGVEAGGLSEEYSRWLESYDFIRDADRTAIQKRIAVLPRRPLISVLLPVFDPPPGCLEAAIASVEGQLYPHWELCVADDASTNPRVAAILAEAAGRDDRIRVVRRPVNGHIAAASQSALDLARGEYVALLDQDDLLAEHALYMLAEAISDDPEVDVLYSDEDKLDGQGRRVDPHFKPDFNKDLLHGCNYVSHLGCFRTALVRRAGGFRPGFDGAQDYDLVLRCLERSSPDRVRHVPHVLYHWRIHAGSTALGDGEKDYAVRASRRALREHLERVGVQADVLPAPGAPGYHRVRRRLPNPPPLVSLVIPTRDRVELLRGCVDGLLTRTDYPALELLIVDNDSGDPAALAYLDELRTDARVRVFSRPGPFNYAALNNFAVRRARGEVIGLLNNDLQVIEPGWLAEMVAQALRPEVGAVGAKLLYADGRVQHGGVILGVGGVAGHAHKLFMRDAPGYFGRLCLVQDLSAVTAACLVMRKALYEAVGGLDETNLAVAFNDVDLCLKLRRMGLLVVWTPQAELFHLESASRGQEDSPEKQARFLAEIAYMLETWQPELARDPAYNPNLTLAREDFSLADPPRAVKPWRRSPPDRPIEDAKRP